VIRPDGTAYLSWYPEGLQGWSHDLKPPESWNGPCRGEVDPGQARHIASRIIRGIDAWFPGIAGAEPLLVDAGAIVAYGRTDVDDPASGLHHRDRAGVVTEGNYHSVDPGKLTTAPWVAMTVVNRVMGRRDAVRV
jgi:hypothetical protein